ncbi:MAG TPA: serine/threonine-protein kinase [Burkholderiaceae bacterium]|nr:serine/threonine-protein kinase [Burkholderiaceae bacterium]
MTTSTLATVPLQPAQAPVRPLQKIGRFTIRGEIGRGANGIVYAAEDPVLGREVAIKAIQLGDDAAFRRRIEASFLQEAKSAAKMNHPGIVTIFDAGKTNDIAYIAMERLHGRDLHQFIASGQQLAPTQAAALMARVADAVHYAHAKGLIHRDIKPSNILLLDDYKPKVLDFGIALANRRERVKGEKRQLVGTPNYMSPEQALGRVLDLRSDIFSLGTILYELLAGKRAFDGGDVEEILAQVISDEPAPIESLRSDVPPALLDIVRRALSKDVDQRFATALEMRNALAAVALDPNLAAHVEAEPAVAEEAERGGRVGALRRHVAFFSAIGLALLAAAILFVGDRSEVADSGASAPQPAVGVISPASPPAPVTPHAGNPDPAPAIAAPAHDNAAPAPDAAAVAKAAAATRLALERRKASAAAAAARSLATPPPEGTVNFAISPWGEVFVNGASRGISPPLNHVSLPPGTYSIEVRNGDAPPMLARIEVLPGQSTNLQHRF